MKPRQWAATPSEPGPWPPGRCTRALHTLKRYNIRAIEIRIGSWGKIRNPKQIAVVSIQALILGSGFRAQGFSRWGLKFTVQALRVQELGANAFSEFKV